MTDELKPVKCGCGGEAIIETVTTRFEQVPRFRIRCEKCNISTVWDYFSEVEAVEAWNRAMSGNVQECAKDARCSERTAKATKNPQAFFYHCECGYVLCAEKNDMKYCPECGAKLEWK